MNFNELFFFNELIFDNENSYQSDLTIFKFFLKYLKYIFL